MDTGGIITTKSHLFSEVYTKTGSPGEAYQAIAPGTIQELATKRGKTWLKKPEVKAKVLELLQTDARTSPDAAVRKLGDLMDSQKVMMTKMGPVDVPDNGVQLEATKTVLKAYGVVSDHVEVDIDVKQEISVTLEDSVRLEEIVRRLEDMNRRLLSDKMQSGEIGDAQIVDNISPQENDNDEKKT